ncbi:MAG TPA: carboxymuconolactone decarboxylase family protein [Gemmatimonadaceae bacterium]
MQPRFDIMAIDPAAYRAMAEIERYLHQSSLEAPLIHIVKLYASEINHCAYCIDMHWKDLRALGETEQRLYGLPAWREAPYYTDRERAAFTWTEAVTVVTDGFVSDEVYEAVRPHFSEKQLVELTMVIVTINSWNRLSIAARTVPGTYQPKQA